MILCASCSRFGFRKACKRNNSNNLQVTLARFSVFGYRSGSRSNRDQHRYMCRAFWSPLAQWIHGYFCLIFLFKNLFTTGPPGWILQCYDVMGLCFMMFYSVLSVYSLLCWTVYLSVLVSVWNSLIQFNFQVTQKTNFHFMHLLWIIKFFCMVCR